MSTVIRPAPGRTRPYRHEVRAGLLAAARTVFLAKGYGETSVAEVAETAGYTKGAVYSNFGGKPELFAEVCRAEFGTAMTEVMADILGAAADAGDAKLPAEAADRIADLVIGRVALQAAAAEFRGLALRSPELAKVYAAMRRDQIDALAGALVEQRLLAPTATREDAHQVAGLILGVINAMALDHAAAPELYPRERIVAAMARLVRGLLA